jgi:hypothetical protein
MRKKAKYKIPTEFFFPLDHVRSRFKNNDEEVLLYVADSIFEIGELPIKEFNKVLNTRLFEFPGNTFKEKKTIDNWRTEISTLFSFIQEKNGKLYPGTAAKRLSIERDFGLFWNYFLLSFQYIGGHIANYSIAKSIKAGVNFKPCPYLLRLLYDGEKLIKKPFSITPEEATFCVFNDLRVTKKKRSPLESAKLILYNRNEKLEYSYDYELLKTNTGNSRTDADNVRSAKDILDYMMQARILKVEHNRYYLDKTNEEAIEYHIKNENVRFNMYKKLENKKFELKDINAIEEDWHKYVNSFDGVTAFRTKINKQTLENISAAAEEIFLNYKGKEKMSTKLTGDLGEDLVWIHECLRTKEISTRQHIIKFIPTPLGVGYDIQSIEVPTKKRYIEVKSTNSFKSLKNSSLNLTINEWDTAETLGDAYFIYFLNLNQFGGDRKIFVVQNPIKEIKKGNLVASAPKDNHILIHLKEKAGKWVKLLEKKN